jgi:hypothetical protein
VSDRITITADELGPVGDELGRGGQGIVYELPSRPHHLLKVYLDDAVDRDGLEALVRWRLRLSSRDRRVIDAMTAWPLAVVPDLSTGLAFVMRRAPTEFFHDRPGGSRPHDLQWAYCTSVAYSGRQPATRRQAVTIVHRLAMVLDVLHRNDVVYGDLSATNVLWSARHGRPRIFLIDCDAAWATIGPRGCGGGQTPNFADPWPSDGTPAAERRRDLYKLGLVFLRLYYRSQLPVTAETPTIDLAADPPITRSVHGLLQGALSPDGDRPTAADWMPRLAALDRRLRAAGVT